MVIPYLWKTNRKKGVTMETEIIVIFCITDDYLKSINFKDDKQTKMPTAEIMTVAIVAAYYFGGNQEKARIFFYEHGYSKNTLSKSQFNRRLHAIDADVWECLQKTLAEVFKRENTSQEYVVDSFPVQVCHNIRISRARIYTEEKYRGYSASKRQYFFGLRVHMITTVSGKPIELVIAPGSFSDITVFREFDCDLPAGSTIYGDAIFNDYHWEDTLQEATDITLLAARKSNSKRPHSLWNEYLINRYRKIIETTFSTITNLFPKKIHAVTAKGFHLKVFCFTLSYSIACL
jgi:Transposase DDE domain